MALHVRVVLVRLVPAALHVRVRAVRVQVLVLQPVVALVHLVQVVALLVAVVAVRAPALLEPLVRAAVAVHPRLENRSVRNAKNSNREAMHHRLVVQ